MGHSQAEKALSRERILDSAAQQIRESGLDSLSIAELMKTANLTHGGFYGHFRSRAELIAAAFDRALERGEAAFVGATPSEGDAVGSIVDRYLSPAHRDNPGEGCAMAALAGDVGRAEDDSLRRQLSAHLEQSFADMARLMGGETQAQEAAIAACCTMIGALTLSRVFRGTDRSDEILQIAQQSVLDLEAHVRSKASTAPSPS